MSPGLLDSTETLAFGRRFACARLGDGGRRRDVVAGPLESYRRVVRDVARYAKRPGPGSVAEMVGEDTHHVRSGRRFGVAGRNGRLDLVGIVSVVVGDTVVRDEGIDGGRPTGFRDAVDRLQRIAVGVGSAVTGRETDDGGRLPRLGITREISTDGVVAVSNVNKTSGLGL